MILFKPEHVEPILSGRKTQTRRLWPKGRRARGGAVHELKRRLFGKPFARVRIRRVWRELLGEISESDARAEGYESREAYLAVFDRINGGTGRDALVWALEFELVDGA